MNEISTISFNVSKTINIGNFEAIKINYGESVTVDPSKDIEQQRKELIENCYKIIKKESSIWQKMKSVQHVGSNRSTTVVPSKS
jgi:ribosome-binding ATPase YchF (GTP1/OBG family)|tara:strand:+ start:1435 stop:1686 length:252 start_codon:yes stop_codon:yes gene_type:complete